MIDVVKDGEVNDLGRLEYLDQHLNAVNDAIENGVDILGYFAWSIIDNFEWAEGFKPRFGLYTVDYSGDYERTRTLGAEVLGEIVQYRHMSPEMREAYGGSGLGTLHAGAMLNAVAASPSSSPELAGEA